MQKNPGLTCASGIELFFMNKANQGRTLAYTVRDCIFSIGFDFTLTA
jgi:hypothetical protein